MAAGEGVLSALESASAAAEEGAEKTRGMAAAAGRSSYVPEAVLRDVPDPGARAVAIWLAALSSVVNSRISKVGNARC